MRIIPAPSPFPKYKIQMRHYLLEFIFVSENTPFPFPNTKYKCHIINWGYFVAYHNFPPPPFPKCKVQMRHYLLQLIFALENTSFLPNTKAKPDIIY